MPLKIALLGFCAFFLNVAQAQPVCGTISECNELISQANVRIAQINAIPELQFTEIATNADGSVKFMNQVDAIKYCRDQGGHLPTARELAWRSMLRQASGIAEIANGQPDLTYRRIRANNANGSQDDFYFSDDGYERSPNDIGNHLFWSSSNFSTHLGELGYLISEKRGSFNEYPLASAFSVICVLN